jgi:hypothetical protein
MVVLGSRFGKRIEWRAGGLVWVTSEGERGS